MNKLDGYMVYWYWKEGRESYVDGVYYTDMTDALDCMERLRKHPDKQFVTMASQNSNMVGGVGSTMVKGGKLPNGDDYDYTKRDALSQRMKNWGT